MGPNWRALKKICQNTRQLGTHIILATSASDFLGDPLPEPDENGGPLWPEVVLQKFDQLCKKYKVTPTTLFDPKTPQSIIEEYRNDPTNPKWNAIIDK